MRFGVMMIVLGLAGCDGSSAIAPKHNIGDRLKLLEEAWACDAAARDELDKQHDRKAFGEVMRRMWQAGRCHPLPPGTLVDVIDVALVSGRTEIRVKGKPDAWWMTTPVLNLYSEKVGSWRQSSAAR